MLDKIEADGKIYLDDKGIYHIFDKSIKYIQGQIFINIDGNGYFKGKRNGKAVQFVIPHKDLNGALSGDIVLINDNKRKQESVR